MTNRILCVDDEINVLKALERHLRKNFDIHIAVGPEDGLAAIRDNGPFAAVVSDLRMPGMNGIQFLSSVRASSPETVRIMLTGQADLADAIAAVNEGNLFQFLTKPCPPEMLARALDAAVKQHALVTAEKELLEKTLLGSVGIMSEILSLINPGAFSRAQRLRRYVREMAEKLELEDRWECEFAAMLSQIGIVAMPPELLEKVRLGQPISPAETEVLESQNRIGFDLVARIPRLDKVAAIIRHQKDGWQAGITQSLEQSRGHLLRVVSDFDDQVTRGSTPREAIVGMTRRREYLPKFLHALEALRVEEEQNEIRALPVFLLRPGMIVNESVKSKTNILLLAQGQEVTESALACLRSFAMTVGINEPISVILRHEPASPGGKPQLHSNELPDSTRSRNLSPA
jgi:ActR/RegA family two-component response regulator